MGEKAIIEINKLVKHYKNADADAVDSMSLRIGQGEIYGLLGPNGAGKTTTISMLCGLLRPDSGDIIIDGLNLKTSADKIKSLIGVVPQDIAIYEELTAKENLGFFGKMYGLKNAEIKNISNSLLMRFRLGEKAGQRAKTFSGGMKRRLNLIAGIMHSPKILFLDEPTVGIDVQSKNVILEFLKEIKESGTTIVYTSHIMEEAEKLCSRISIMDRGKEIASGTPKDLLEKNTDCKNLEDIFLKLTGRKLRE